jgi:membrane protein required for colicin V production
MNWADWTIVGIVAVSGLISLQRGFVREALSLVNWGLAFIIAITFRDQLALLLADAVETPSLREMLSFGILFAATLIVGALVNHLICELVKITGLSGTDRLFGMLFGLTRGVIVVLAILLLLPSVVPVDKDSWWQQSQLIPRFLLLEDWSRETASLLMKEARELFNG